MGDTAVLCDATVIWPQASLGPEQHVYVLPSWLALNGRRFESTAWAPPTDAFPPSLFEAPGVAWVPPSPAMVREMLERLGRCYRSLVVLTSSADLTAVYYHVREAAAGLFHSLHLQFFDSRSLGLVLGWQVSLAAQLTAQGLEARDIVLQLRRALNRYYALLTVRSVSYLYRMGLLDAAQAWAAERLRLTPLFLLEEGRLVPLYKARSGRHLFDLYQEFVEEFDAVERMGLVYGSAMAREAAGVADRLRAVFPQAEFCLQEASPVLQALFGPQTLMLFLQEAE